MKRILVVEDDADARRALDIRLRANNYEPHFAADVPSAVASARKSRPDLVLLDIGLPGGSGFTVLDEFRSLPETLSVPVIILTGRDTCSNRCLALEYSVEDFLQKPVENRTLFERIACRLEKLGT